MHSGVYTEAMQAVFDGLESAEKFPEISRVPAGSNIVEAKWLLKSKGDEHGMIDRAKSRLVAQGCSQLEGVDYLSLIHI